MKAVLLAAGLGKRLLPITESIPKPMIPIAGKPILEYIITELADLGFDEICLITGYLEEQVRNYFGNGHKFNTKITYFSQPKYFGTANALKFAKDWIGDDPFLSYLSDTIIPNDLKHILPRMINDKSEISIISSPVSKFEIVHSGSVEEQNGLVTRLSEKTENPRSTLAWAGIAFFKSSLIFDLIQKMQPSTSGEYELTDAMNLALKRCIKIRNYLCKEFIDSGSYLGLIKTMEYILNQKHSCKNTCIKNYKKIYSPLHIGKKCFFGKNTILGPFVSIGNNVTIGDDVTIEHSLVINDSKIPSGKKIIDCIINQDKIISRSVIDSKNNVLS